jgi:DNA repair exonuclease SbcCD ATPase subunit
MAEELVMNVKSNIKSVTKETQDWAKSLKEVNEQIEIQEKVITSLDKDLIKLKAQQDKIPKGAWVAGMDSLNAKIKKTTTEIKLEKNALTGLKQEQKKASSEVKKFNAAQKETNKELQEGVGNFRVMGVSLNGIKASFGKIIPLAKTMFGTIKAGLISTGIGAFVVLIGSLVTFFTDTKRGADKLSQAFTAMGAVLDVLNDRMSKVGEAISFIFSGEFRKAGEALKGTFSGIADEMEREVKAMVALKKRTQELRDADMEFMVQKAATRQEIEKARLIAEDETKSAQERLDNLKKALELEEKTTQRELVLAKERMDIQIQEMALSENSAEDEQKLAELKVALIEKETASVKMRRRVVTEVNSLEREISAEQKAREKERLDGLEAERKALQDIMDLETERLNQQLITAAGLLDAHYQSQLEKIDQEKNAVTDKWFAIIEAEEEGSAMRLELEKAYQEQLAAIDEKFAKKDKKKVKDATRTFKELSEQEVKWADMTANEKMNIASKTAGTLATILGEETAAGKAAAIIQATIDTYKSAQAAYASLAGIPVVGPVLGGVAAAAAVASGIKNVQAIQSAGGGGGGGGNITAPATTTTETPAPQMMSGDFDLTGGIAPEPVKAFVVTDEMSNSQNQLANIRRRATI